MPLVFNDFSLDPKTRQLLREGKERRLEPKAFDLLALLLRRRPEAVSKGEIQEQLWPGTFVSESSLTGLVTQIRQALDDDPRKARFLRTVHGFGYAFCGTVVEEGGRPRQSQAARRRAPAPGGLRLRSSGTRPPLSSPKERTSSGATRPPA
jgi:DNA-binding winged helix-turn-helix (wHTH) protein